MIRGIVGEHVVVKRPRVVGEDRLGSPIMAHESESVANVLVDRPTTTEPGVDRLSGVERPNGDTSGWTLHFPKSYTGSLRGCDVVVRGKTYRVIGDPDVVKDSPTRWNRPVRVEADDG